MSDRNTVAEILAQVDLLRESVIRRAIGTLELPSGSRGLDAGCGIGSHIRPLAEAVGHKGHVTGLDMNPEFLALAKEGVERSELVDRTSFREGDIGRLPFDADTFDWIWSADCTGYPVGELLPVLREFTRVVVPGGTVAILGWTSQQVLPGHPLLEARLNATCFCAVPYFRGTSPEHHFSRALGRFREAGLKDSRAETFVGTVHAPLNGEIRRALVSLLEMLYGERLPEVSEEDWREFQRLCQPNSPDFILNLPDYYAFFTYTMFHGTV